MQQQHESQKYHNACYALDAFDAFDSNAHLVMAEHHEWNKFYAAFDAFDAF